MRLIQRPCAWGVLALALLLGPYAGLVGAQSGANPTPPVTSPTAPPAAAGDGSSLALTFGLLLGLVVLVAIAGKILDLRRKREEEAVHLQAQVSDALLREAALAGLAVTPVAHVPWRGSPATLVVSGHVPTPELREAALRIARQEAARIRPDVVIEDRLAIVPVALPHAA
jgi:hypothetical protein